MIGGFQSLKSSGFWDWALLEGCWVLGLGFACGGTVNDDNSVPFQTPTSGSMGEAAWAVTSSGGGCVGRTSAWGLGHHPQPCCPCPGRLGMFSRAERRPEGARQTEEELGGLRGSASRWARSGLNRTRLIGRVGRRICLGLS